MKKYAQTTAYDGGLNGNAYVRTGGGKRNPKAGPVTVLKPVQAEVRGLGVQVEVLKPVNVIKAPRRKPMDKEDRRYLGY